MTQDHPHDAELRAAERHASLSRRRFLRGVGACLALPALESLVLPRSAQAAFATKRALAVSAATGAPLRMAFVYVPNGTIQDKWWPTGTGAEFELNKTMKPLEPVKKFVQVLSNMDQVNSTPGPDGAGDHARASGTWLTGVRVKKTAGADIHAGISIDQVVARQIGHITRFPSLELTCDAVRRSGNCDSGYSCAYQYNLAWSSPTTPVAPEPNPRLVFERLFGAGAPGHRRASLKQRQAEQRSILDFVLEDTRTLERQLGSKDTQKLDEYLTSVRELERRIEQAERFGETPDPEMETPPGIPPSFEEHIRIMFSLMLLAFQTDSTRVSTFLMANEGSNRPFPEIGIPEGHHSLTHHRNDQTMIDKVAEIDQWYIHQLAWFLQRLEETRDSDGNPLLQNTMLVYGSGNADGNRHTHTNLPIILAGGGGGTLTAGRFAEFPSTPMSNMLLSLADRMGVTGVESLGDSTGRLEGI